MFKTARRSLCNAAAAAAATSASTTTTTTASSSSSGTVYGQGTKLIDSERLKKFEQWARANKCNYDGCSLVINEEQGRGMKAIKKFYQGQTVASVPLRSTTLSAQTLIPNKTTLKNGKTLNTTKPHEGWGSQALIESKIPTYDTIRKIMLLHGCHDPMMYRQFHLACAVAVERMNPNSKWLPYFESLPHPAIDDEAVMGLYKNSIDIGQKIEWQDYLNEFHLMAKAVVERWGEDKAPPVPIILWAWRTVLARNNPFPNRQFDDHIDVGGLNFRSVFEILRAKSRFQILADKFLGGEKDITEFEMIPTLTPVIDLVSHVQTGNVAMEMRSEHTDPEDETSPKIPIIELQAVTTIQPGDTIGYRFSRAHDTPFTLFRFGFLPL